MTLFLPTFLWTGMSSNQTGISMHLSSRLLQYHLQRNMETPPPPPPQSSQGCLHWFLASGVMTLFLPTFLWTGMSSNQTGISMHLSPRLLQYHLQRNMETPHLKAVKEVYIGFWLVGLCAYFYLPSCGLEWVVTKQEFPCIFPHACFNTTCNAT